MPCVHHVTRVHLPNIDDWSSLHQWLAEMDRWACLQCRTVNARSRPCLKCKRRITAPADGLAGLSPSEPLPEWDDSLWSTVLENSLPVIRSIPLGAQSQWFRTLAREIQQSRDNPTSDSIARLGAFCRLALAPLGRGGRKHCRQAVSVVSARLARWEAGQYQSLVREYLESSLCRPRDSPSSPTNLGEEALPESVRRAALRAVRDGALGKAARILAQVHHPLPTDTKPALQALHPPGSDPAVPAGRMIVGEDFSLDEIRGALASFSPGSSGGFSGLMPAHLRGEDTPEYLSLLQQLCSLCSDFAWNRLP